MTDTVGTAEGHAPLPWRIDTRAKARVVSGDDDTIATTRCQSSLQAHHEANAALIVTAVNERPKLLAKLERYEKALARIEKWLGEFPETGKLWDNGAPMSYSAAYGSNGERDYMRSVARAALQPEQETP
jgi:hypothetical protein